MGKINKNNNNKNERACVERNLPPVLAILSDQILVQTNPDSPQSVISRYIITQLYRKYSPSQRNTVQASVLPFGFTLFFHGLTRAKPPLRPQTDASDKTYVWYFMPLDPLIEDI